ncbi:unnamed protein product, partial [Polarella glacialis]
MISVPGSRRVARSHQPDSYLALLKATAVLPPESWLRSLAGLSIPGTFFASESWSVSNETLDWLSGQRDSYAQSASKGAKSRKEDKRQEERTREERRREE